MINRTPVWQPPLGQPGLRQPGLSQPELGQPQARLGSPLLPLNWTVVRQGLQAEPISRLMKFVSVLALISALTCVYLWQASTISEINDATATIKADAIKLERSNAGLAIDVTRWNGPAHIEDEARRQGMTPDQQPIYVVVPELTRDALGAGASGDLSTQLWLRLTGWLPNKAALAVAMR
ncbi:MAG: hypothetical protein AUK03_03095 [Anaerolineae bacterium CG2_30_64_16]|nr:MAG: hypothetical protein AUK03_03095 [Anaerolineae bacterium CG2_30_64_16]